MYSVLNKLKNILLRVFSQKGIAKSLLVWIIVFSSIITFLLTTIQLYVDYRLEVHTIENRLDEIERSYKRSIEASLWNVDISQLDIQLEGIMRLPDMQAVSVREQDADGGSLLVSKGEKNNVDIHREYMLVKEIDGDVVEIGTLSVEASLDAVYARLINKALTILLIQGVQTFLVSFFILFVFYRLVTRHIVAIQHFLNRVNIGDSFSPLQLDRTKRLPDELDDLTNAYNVMLKNLQQAYSDVQTVNLQLKKDIAARKNAEKELSLFNEELEYRVQIRTAELEATNKEFNEFCFSVSQDLRAPLRRARGFKKNMITENMYKLDQQTQYYLARIDICIQEIEGMIDSFLTLARSTNTKLQLASVDLSAVLSKALAALQERDPHREVSCDIQEHVITYCDPKLIDLLITNLIDNAWKYTVNTEGAEIKFYRKKHNKEVIYVIEDNGIGFNIELASHLFAPFVRLHKLSDFQGVGIGLAAVKRVAVRHGGRVWAESTLGKGAKFFFTLKAPGA